MNMERLNRCVRCYHFVSKEELLPLTTPTEPGDRLPAGRCPECRDLCFPAYLPASEWLDALMAANNQLLEALAKMRDLLVQVDAPAGAFAVGDLMSRMQETMIEHMRGELQLVAIRAEPEPELPDLGPLMFSDDAKADNVLPNLDELEKSMGN